MDFNCYSTSKICYKFIKDHPLHLKPDYKKIDPSSERFFFGLAAYGELMKHKERMDSSMMKRFYKKIKLSLNEYFLSEQTYNQYKDKAVKECNLINDYDEFKDEINRLYQLDKMKFGLICEVYLCSVPVMKTVLKYYDEDENTPFYYNVSKNKKYFIEGFNFENLKITYSPDWSDYREILEFKSTWEEKNLKNKLDEAYCQALFYAFIDYHVNYYRFQLLYKLWRRLFFYKIVVEVYVAERNKVFVYGFNLNYDHFRLIKEISDYSKNDSKVDIYNLIRYGKCIKK